MYFTIFNLQNKTLTQQKSFFIPQSQKLFPQADLNRQNLSINQFELINQSVLVFSLDQPQVEQVSTESTINKWILYVYDIQRNQIINRITPRNIQPQSKFLNFCFISGNSRIILYNYTGIISFVDVKNKQSSEIVDIDKN